MSDKIGEDVAILLLLAIVFLAMILGACIGYSVSSGDGEARCESIGGEYSYAADVYFKNGEEV